MKKSLDLDLNLPEAPAFISRPPQYSVSAMIKLSEQFLPIWNLQRSRISEKELPVETFRLIEEPDSA